MEEVRKEKVGCSVICREDECRTVCSIVTKTVVEELAGRREFIEDVDLDDVEFFREEKPMEGLEKAKDLSKKYGYSVYSRENFRILLRDGEIMGLATDSEDTSRKIMESLDMEEKEFLCKNYEFGGRDHHICVRKYFVERASPEEFHEHPSVMTAFTIRFPIIVPPPTPLTTATRDGEPKGSYIDYEGVITINESWRFAEEVMCSLGLKSVNEYAEDYMQVVIHETAHFMQHMNAEGFKGGWDANPFAVIFGIPSPWGSEAVAEEIADVALDFMNSTDIRPRKRVLEETNERVRWTSETEAVEMAKKFLEEVKRRGYDYYFGGGWELDVDYEEMSLSIHIEDMGDREAYEKLRKIYDEMEKRGEVSGEYLELEWKALTGGFITGPEVPRIKLKFPGLSTIYTEVEYFEEEY